MHFLLQNSVSRLLAGNILSQCLQRRIFPAPFLVEGRASRYWISQEKTGVVSRHRKPNVPLCENFRRGAGNEIAEHVLPALAVEVVFYLLSGET